jgi:SAM-dependent methyltransferase
MTSQPGLVFGVDPGHYDVHRPAMSSELAAWLLPPDCGLAVELGSGTGHFTRILLQHAKRVIATDPDPQMCAWLRERFPSATVHQGTAEDIPVETGSADGVFSNCAWHWFDPRATGMEAARCLKPGGVLGISWHDRGLTDDLWLDEIQEVIFSAHHPDRPIHEANLPEDLPFTPMQKQVTTYHREMSPEEICAMFTTYSALITLPEAERHSLLERFRDHLRAKAAERGTETLSVPFVATLYRAYRLA